MFKMKYNLYLENSTLLEAQQKINWTLKHKPGDKYSINMASINILRLYKNQWMNK